MNIRKLFIFISISAALTACVPQELPDKNGGNGAEGSGSSSYTGEGCSLELVIRGGDYGSGASTKSYYEDSIRVATAEFKRLMLMIIDDTGKLVAYRVLKQGAATESGVTVHDYFTNTDKDIDITFDNPAKPYVRNKTPDPSDGVHNYIVNDPENPIPATGVNNFIVEDGTKPIYNEIHLEFIYTNPLHTETNADLSSERLTPGWYTILAIGNYNDEIFTGTGDFGDNGYYGPTDKTVKKILDNIYYEFNNAEKDGIDNFAPYKYDGSAWVSVGTQFQAGKDLINFAYKLAPNSKVDPTDHGSETNKTDFMRSAAYDIIVSKVERFFLNPGQNNFDMELKRTTARVEFEIENFSERKMKIVGLEFSPTFASGNTWLFPHTAMSLFDWTDNDRDIFRQKSSLSGIWGIGAMDPQGPSAVVKFDDTKTYAKGEAHTFFDCLIYETRPLASVAVPYWYSLGVIPEKSAGSDEFYDFTDDEDYWIKTTSIVPSYSGLSIGNSGKTLKAAPSTKSTVTESTTNTNKETIVTKSTISETNTQYNNVYLIKSMRNDGSHVNANKLFLYDDNGTVKSKSFDSDIEKGIDGFWQEDNRTAYLWKWTGSTFQNCKTNRYLNIPTGYASSITTSTTATKLYFSSFGDGDSQGVIIKGGNSAEYSLNMNGTGFLGTYTGGSNDYGNNIGVFQVTFAGSIKNITTKHWGKELVQHPVKAIDDGSSDAMPYYLNEINRNEHLKVRIGVSFNENSQKLDFQVKSWTEKTNTFEFE